MNLSLSFSRKARIIFSGQYFHIDSKVPARLLSGPRSTQFDKTTLKPSADSSEQLLAKSPFRLSPKNPEEEEIMGNQSIDRRSFLKGAAATAATVIGR